MKTPFNSITDLPTTLQGYGITDAAVAKTSSTLDITTPGLYVVNTTTGIPGPGSPTSCGLLVVNVESSDASACQQIAFDTGTGLYVRYGSSNIWSPWSSILEGPGNFTSGRVLVSVGKSSADVSAITTTELLYLDGVTSNIQTQLDNKAEYETGTWYPSMNTSYTDREGRYVKIGRFVYVTGSITYSSAPSGASMFELSGLPFSASSSPIGFSGQFTVFNTTGTGWWNGTDTVRSIDTGVYFSGSYAYPYYVSNGSNSTMYGWTRNTIGSYIGSSGLFRISGSYYTAS